MRAGVCGARPGWGRMDLEVGQGLKIEVHAERDGVADHDACRKRQASEGDDRSSKKRRAEVLLGTVADHDVGDADSTDFEAASVDVSTGGLEDDVPAGGIKEPHTFVKESLSGGLGAEGKVCPQDVVRLKELLAGLLSSESQPVYPRLQIPLCFCKANSCHLNSLTQADPVNNCDELRDLE